MDWNYRLWRSLKRKIGLFSPPVVYHIQTVPLTREGPERKDEFANSLEKVTHELHTFIAESQRRINICSMNHDHHVFLYTSDVVIRLWNQIEKNNVEVRAVVSPMTAQTFEHADIECRVSYAPARDFILIDNSRSIILRDSRAYIYYTLDLVPTLSRQFHKLYNTAH